MLAERFPTHAAALARVAELEAALVAIKEYKPRYPLSRQRDLIAWITWTRTVVSLVLARQRWPLRPEIEQ